ncbi:hypothetical protein Tco_0142721, partial [Tanacetum coccineum]
GDERKQIKKVHITESHKYRDEQEQTRQVHSTKSHKYGDEREQIRQIAADNNKFRQTADRILKQQIQTKQQIMQQIPKQMQTNQSRTK